MIQHFPVLIPILPMAASMICILVSKLHKDLGKYIVTLTLAISFIGSLSVLSQIMTTGETIHYWMGGWAPPLGIEFVIDQVNAIIAVAISALAFFGCVYGQPFFKKEGWFEEGGYFALYALLSAGLLGMTLTGDMFNLYVFLEIASLSGYGLIALGGDKGTLSAFRYLLMGTIAASFYLLAVAYLYAITGTLNMADMGVLLADHINSPNVLLALAMFIIAFGIKMAMFPLHGWQPDAYTYSHPAAAPLISGAMSKAPALAMLRYMFYIVGLDSIFVEKSLMVIGILGAAGIVIGSIMAIAQKDFRRMLAYSSVAQISYIAVGLAMGNLYGLVAVVLHVINHAFMKGSLFMVMGGVRYRYGIVDINKFGGLNKHMPFTVFTLVVAALSMVGIPPTGGFFSKWYLILGAMDNQQYFYIVVLVISCFLNAIYFFRVIENIFISKDAELEEIAPKGRFELPLSMLIPIVLFGLAIIALGVFNAPIVKDIIMLGLPEVIL